MEEKIGNLKPNMENVSVTVRVLEASDSRQIQTKNGLRTISEAIVGDETGRVKLTLWGKHAGSIKEGQVIKIENAWTTAFKGQVQLNAGSKTKISEVSEDGFPDSSQIPETTPTAPQQMRGGGRGYKGGRRYGRRGGRRQESEEGEEE
ncbi:MAG: OB-fold nucleic acid binding domain-containing protein [Saccharolobus sp.]|jgi:replication factor A1|uniref:Single-stranded DNA-binding protein n=1 Tax=Saccharolobus caldissimus TaxID=1702097 RepID=A0AAQ4CSX8_9CREN|nr:MULTISPECIES: OB-fold nucleic acid binding domain-containing protein [Saccharolobus]MDT7860638.1 OB-fold nucleic acid binding domain-containing protein [Saccharolobus sp.]BDB98909.1 single-stranded DNA-binding protein [Saccharolobus caldissimus]